jgi:Ca2+-binding RTX toxin-like protein
MAAAGYTLDANSTTRENAAINLYSSLGSLASLVADQHKAYFVDTANADGGRGHRIQMMLDALKEVGVGITTGPYDYTDPNTHQTTTYQGFVSVIDFGAHDDRAYLTGVAYLDYVDHNNFYTPGEGIGGLRITAVRASDGKTFTTQTWQAGGYTLQLSPGTYNIYGYGDSIGGFIAYKNVTVSHTNVKEDFQPAQIGDGPFTLFADGTLWINGTSGADRIDIRRIGSNYVVRRSGASPQAPATFDATKVKSIRVDLEGGNDVFSVGKDVQAVSVKGGLGHDNITGGDGNDTLVDNVGNDTIFGGAGDDLIMGGKGRDSLDGGAGDDYIRGGADNDRIFGEDGADRAFGDAGDDWLVGGNGADKLNGGDGNDRLEGENQSDVLDGAAGNDTILAGNGNDAVTGGPGNDQLFGNRGDDTFDALDGAIDTLNGGAGTNTGTFDANDVRAAVQ